MARLALTLWAFSNLSSVHAGRRSRVQLLSTDIGPSTNASHTYGDCDCAYTSGNKASCCAAKNGAGMANGNFCGSSLDRKNYCSAENPVCCTSHAAGAVCCPAGSSCSTSCRGDGGRTKFDGGRCKCLPPNKESVASRTFRLPLAKMFASLAQASYCGPDYYSPFWFNLTKWNCGDECGPAGLRLQENAMVRVTRKDRKNPNGTFAYISKFETVPNGNDQGPDAPKAGDCIVGFAGSMNIDNWIRNFQANKIRGEKAQDTLKLIPRKLKVKFHRGFTKVWHALSSKPKSEGVIYELNKLGCGPDSGHQVFITGQSLGASVATIAMIDLQVRGFKVGLSYVFNSPRIGNKHTMQYYRTAFGREISLFRITNGKDPVTRLAPSANGYLAVGAEAYFPPNWDDQRLSYVICQDEEDFHCSKRYNVVRTLGGGDDHCESSLVKGGNICALPDFCNDPANPMSK